MLPELLLQIEELLELRWFWSVLDQGELLRVREKIRVANIVQFLAARDQAQMQDLGDVLVWYYTIKSILVIFLIRSLDLDGYLVLFYPTIKGSFQEIMLIVDAGYGYWVVTYKLQVNGPSKGF